MLRCALLLALIMMANFFNGESLQTQDKDKSDQSLHIDVVVKLERGNVVFNIDHLALFGDMPFAIAHINVVNKDFNEWGANGKIVAIFHSDAGYIMLDDDAYNENRHINTGNPYKALIQDMMKRGIQVELCGLTAKVNNWVNSQLIPGVKVNTNAMVRLIQLEQEGYQLL